MGGSGIWLSVVGLCLCGLGLDSKVLSFGIVGLLLFVVDSESYIVLGLIHLNKDQCCNSQNNRDQFCISSNVTSKC